MDSVMNDHDVFQQYEQIKALWKLAGMHTYVEVAVKLGISAE